MSKTPNQILWAFEPKKGSLLHEPMAQAREHMATIEELQALREERVAQLRKLQKPQEKVVTARSDPQELLPSNGHHKAQDTLEEIVVHIDEELAKVRTRLRRPKIAAEDLWYELVSLEKKWKTHLAQAEHFGDEGPYEAHAAAAKKELEARYKEVTGRRYDPQEPLGATVTWQPPGERTFEPLLQAATVAQEAGQARRQERIAHQREYGSTFGARVVSPEAWAEAAGMTPKEYEEWKKQRKRQSG